MQNSVLQGFLPFLARRKPYTELSDQQLQAFFDERLRLDDGMFARKGVERGQTQAPRPTVGVDEAERRRVNAMLGWEVVQQAALLAVGSQLLLHVQENLRRQHFDLKADLIIDAVRTRQLAGVFVAQPIVE